MPNRDFLLALIVTDAASAEAAIKAMFERFGGWHPDDPAVTIAWELNGHSTPPSLEDSQLIDQIMERCFSALGESIYDVASRIAGLES